MNAQMAASAPLKDFTVTDDDQFLRDQYDKSQNQNGK